MTKYFFLLFFFPLNIIASESPHKKITEDDFPGRPAKPMPQLQQMIADVKIHHIYTPNPEIEVEVFTPVKQITITRGATLKLRFTNGN